MYLFLRFVRFFNLFSSKIKLYILIRALIYILTEFVPSINLFRMNEFYTETILERKSIWVRFVILKRYKVRKQVFGKPESECKF